MAKVKRQSIYDEVTNRIVKMLEKGIRPWKCPWDKQMAALTNPINAATNNNYRGINLLLLMTHEKVIDTGDPRFCSYKQAQDKDWQVRKGEKGTRIFFFKELKVEDKDPNEPFVKRDEEGNRLIPMLRSYTVFHASQIDNIPDYTPPKRSESFNAIEEIEIMVKNSGAVVKHGGSRAFYSPNADIIQLPHPETFKNASEYGKTKLHELGHWTGGGKGDRVPRNMKSRKGSPGYAREELRAEISSAFMFAELGLANDLQPTVDYIGDWVKVLKNDKQEIFRAAADAQKISDYCLQFSPEINPEATSKNVAQFPKETENENKKNRKHENNLEQKQVEQWQDKVKKSSKGNQITFDW